MGTEKILVRDHGFADEDHSNMITQMGGGLPMMDDLEMHVAFNNDFIGKNKNMLAFFREHDQEKRTAFTKLRDYFSLRAKISREADNDAKRSKVINYMTRWDEYRVRREEVIDELVLM